MGTQFLYLVWGLGLATLCQQFLVLGSRNCVETCSSVDVAIRVGDASCSAFRP